MWCHTNPSVDQRTYRCRHLHRRNLEGLPKTHRCQLYRTDVFLLMHDCSCFSWKIYPCQIQQSKLFKILAELIHTESQTDVDKYRVTGILNSLHKCFRSMSSYFVTSDLPILHHPISRTLKSVIQFHYACFQTGRGRNNLKSRPWLISIVNTAISPHLIQEFLLLLRIFRICCRLFFSICCQKFLRQCKRIIQIKFWHIHHRQYFSILRIHQQDRHPICLLFLHHFLCRLLSIFLNVIVYAELQCIPRYRFDAVFCNPIQFNPTGICCREDHSVLSFQILLILHFQPDDSLIIPSGKSEHF